MDIEKRERTDFAASHSDGRQGQKTLVRMLEG